MFPKIFLGICVLGLFALTATRAHAQTAPSDPMPAWVELGAGSKVIARTVTLASTCPAIQLDGKSRRMNAREPRPKDFDNGFPVVCEAIVPERTKIARINGNTLPLIGQSVSKVVAFGDTGCRLKGSNIQNCEKDWFFAGVTAEAAKAMPDLVIHVGDYYYRENECGGPKECDGKKYWSIWNEDFFHPAAPLLKASPWIFTRGNHEDCQRGGEAWFYLLYPGEGNPCAKGDPAKPSPLYTVRAGDLNLAVVDSATSIDDTKLPNPEIVNWYAQQLQTAAAPHTWLISHKPFWGFLALGKITLPVNWTLSQAFQKAKPTNVDWVISGHVHLYEVLKVKDGPMQLIAGSGGTKLDEEVRKDQVPADSVTVEELEHRFGYAMFEKQPTGRWNASFMPYTHQ